MTADQPLRWALMRLAVVLLVLLANVAVAVALPADGFTEPYRTIEVGSAETGTISAVEVREGDEVRQGDVLAVLDRDVLSALLAIAEQAMRSRGELDATTAELRLKRHRLAKLELLRTKGHAYEEEVERARADVAIAEAQVRSAKEELLIRKLEHRKILAQIEQRTLRAPMDGVIVRIQKDIGEYVAPNDPYVLTLVQLDPLLVTFSLTSAQAEQLHAGQEVLLWSTDAVTETTDSVQQMQGTVEYVAPVTDADSGTVRVKIRVANPDGRYRAGERYTLDLSAGDRQASR